MISMTSSEESVRWTLPVQGFQVIVVEFGAEIRIQMFGPRPSGERFATSLRISFGGAFTYVTEFGVSQEFHSERDSWDSMTPLLGLRHRLVVSAVADSLSNVQIRFDDSSSLSAGPDEKYENWAIIGPGDLHLVAVPDGGDPRIAGDLEL
jgi:hypothetical protein